jgi:hypothetical protein
MLGVDGREFQQWALEELTARGKILYRREDNFWIPMLADGTSLEGYICNRNMPGFAQKGSIIQSWQTDLTDFWAYALAYKMTGDGFMWSMARSIARGNHLGDIGVDPEARITLNLASRCANAHALLGFLCLYNKTQKQSFLDMARGIGDNILAQRFHKGFFVPSDRHTYAKLDAVETLVLLHLYASLKPECPRPPQVWPSNARFMAPYRQKGGVVFDVSMIYTLTEFTGPPLSINEAAAMGKTELVESLLADGTDADNVEHDAFITPLHRAAQNGHEEIVKLLLAAEADVNAKEGWPGRTALHYAVENDHEGVAEILIREGADVNTKDNRGRTPLWWARNRGHTEIVELLRKHGAKE